jgi:glutamine amidotransferase
MKQVVVVDYGMGNLRSVSKAAEHVALFGTKVTVSSHAEDVHNADAIIFPGQGAARACMQNLIETGLEKAIRQAAQEKPFLGICMGMQVLMDYSEENEGVHCLGILPGEVTPFHFSDHLHLKVPHMGWNEIDQVRDHPLWQNIPNKSRFYFVHSYYVQPAAHDLTAGITDYGHPFTAAVAKDNIFAIQAHPEKSADVGLQLLKNFLEWNGTL